MYDSPITKNEWQTYSLKGFIKDSANYIHFGATTEGAGLFYLDNFTLKVQEKDGSWNNVTIANSGFEEALHYKFIRYWRADYANKNFSYNLSPKTPDSNENSNSLLIKSEFTPNEIPIEIKSIKLNAKGQDVLLENIAIIDVINGKQKVQSVLIRDKKIVEIKKKISADSFNIIKIDGTGKWLLPGLIDSHVHLFQSGSLYTRPDAFDLRTYRPYNEERKWLRVHAADLLKRYLQCGITTIIDVGGPMYNFKIRDRYSNNTEFPNIYLTGPLISTYQPKAFDIEDSPIIKAHTVENAVNLVKEQLPYKPNFIKIWYINNENTELNYEIVKATIEESHKHNLKVAVHATDLETAKRALKAKADILVHSVDEPIDKEFIQMIKKTKVSYVPTLMVSNQYAEAFSQEISFTNEELRLSNPFPIKSFQDYKHLGNIKLFNDYKRYGKLRKKALATFDKIKADNLALLQKHNINIATGTDAGNIGTLHATSYQQELQDMKTAGLSNLEIIQASTINAAKVLDKDNEIGSIEVSKMADLIILDKNPLEDIKALQQISHVVKAGSVYKKEDILEETPENIVQRQVNAYNLGNVEAFLETYSDDIEIYTFPDILEKKGKEEFKKDWKEFFEEYPYLHCEILNRTTRLNTVIDHERIKYSDGNYSEIIAIYKIENGKIAKVYFVED
ncbi:amidohydrolase family protein [uncultured Kordia sp.]|uniref:amidohydrolase family protein n=1 Tax=uncultured Kordia sp. TaxID=507699 RepID=UPI002629C088|nr:amidohydrolase family protein [uncultured Kordia sp.]